MSECYIHYIQDAVYSISFRYFPGNPKQPTWRDPQKEKLLIFIY